MALVEVSIVPVGTGQASYSSFVAQACQVAAQRGVKYQVTPTGTVLEGSLSQVLPVAQAMHEAAFQAGVQRVVTNIHIDERRDRPQTIEHAVAAAQSPQVAR